jgi:hypothetical protein
MNYRHPFRWMRCHSVRTRGNCIDFKTWCTLLTIVRQFRCFEIPKAFIMESTATGPLCCLVVRVPGYRSRGPSSIPTATRISIKMEHKIRNAAIFWNVAPCWPCVNYTPYTWALPGAVSRFEKVKSYTVQVLGFDYLFLTNEYFFGKL